MTLPEKSAARSILKKYVRDQYQQHHAEMVGCAMEGYAKKWNEDSHLWWITGYFHDIDYEKYPNLHPGPSLQWFLEWGYPNEMIHAVEAHANGFNGFSISPNTLIAKTLIACDEICGIFYAYQKLHPVPYSEMKTSSIKKRLKEVKFAPNIQREHIYSAVDNLSISIDEHIDTLINSFRYLES
jgi:predicted hydrolase (HD superfamily)